MRISLVLSGLLAGTAFFVGCGSSSPSADTIIKGYLEDSPIAGVSYSCGDITGTTLSTGEFSCKKAPVTFKIGGLTLGTIAAFTADKKVYPQDLVGVARSNFTDTKLIGLTRLLQSLDDDGNITEAITIPSDVAAKFGASAAGANWAALAEMAGVPLVDAQEAMEHLKGNLTPTAKSLLAGKTLYTTVNSEMGTLEKLVFNATMTSLAWTELVGGSENGTSAITNLHGLTLTVTDDEGADVITITEVLKDYIVVATAGEQGSTRVYFDETKARAYFLANNEGGSSDNGTWIPVTNNFTCNPAPITLQGMTMDMRYAAEGDISVSCVSVGVMTVGQYALDVDSLEITQLIKVDRYEGTVPQGSFLGTETNDYQAGTVHIVHSGAGDNLDCVETYASILPETIDSVSKLESLMEYSPSQEMLTHTTCPASYYEEGDGGGDDDSSGSGINRTNYTFTDSTGKTHLISTETKGSR